MIVCWKRYSISSQSPLGWVATLNLYIYIIKKQILVKQQNTIIQCNKNCTWVKNPIMYFHSLRFLPFSLSTFFFFSFAKSRNRKEVVYHIPTIFCNNFSRLCNKEPQKHINHIGSWKSWRYPPLFQTLLWSWRASTASFPEFKQTRPPALWL